MVSLRKQENDNLNKGGGCKSLTLEQRELVSKNHNLIYKFLLNSKLDINEYYGSAAIGMCKAAKSFDENRGISFSTYSFICMKNECSMQMREERRNKYDSNGFLIISLQEELEINSSDRGKVYLEDTIQDILKDTEQESLLSVKINEFFKDTSERDKGIILKYVEGYNQSEIGDIFNLSQSYISRIIKKFKICLEGKIS